MENQKKLPWLSKAIVTRNINGGGGGTTTGTGAKIPVLKYEKVFCFLIISVRQVHIVGLFQFIF